MSHLLAFVVTSLTPASQVFAVIREKVVATLPNTPTGSAHYFLGSKAFCVRDDSNGIASGERLKRISVDKRIFRTLRHASEVYYLIISDVDAVMAVWAAIGRDMVPWTNFPNDHVVSSLP
jgi:hypothetical protein